jgi:hypothetical protein
MKHGNQVLKWEESIKYLLDQQEAGEKYNIKQSTVHNSNKVIKELRINLRGKFSYRKV